MHTPIPSKHCGQKLSKADRDFSLGILLSKQLRWGSMGRERERFWSLNAALILYRIKMRYFLSSSLLTNHI